MQHVLALLRLANHDSEVFYKFKQVLIDKIVFPYSTELIQMDVRGDIEKVTGLARVRIEIHDCASIRLIVIVPHILAGVCGVLSPTRLEGYML